MKLAVRIVLIVAIALAVGTGGLLAARQWLLVKRIAPKEALPLQGESAPLKAILSSVSLPIRMALPALANRINGTIPGEFSGDHPVSIPIAHDTHATYTVRRQPFVFSPAANGAIAYSVNVQADGAVHYRWLLDQEHNGFQAAATISGELKPEIASDWQIHPNLSTKVDVHQASVNFIRTISIRGFLTDRINETLPGLTANGITQINAALKSREQLAAYWAQAYRTIQVSGNPTVYLQMAPTAVRIQQGRCGLDGVLAAGSPWTARCARLLGQKREQGTGQISRIDIPNAERGPGSN
jgi:Domain of unknown function (DUF4403)